MYHIKQAIVTEGKFDTVRINKLFDAPVIETGGFAVFKNKEIKDLIKRFALDTGIIVLTDSDPAGLKIRNYINDFVKKGTVLNAYVPSIKGKEKRKEKPGAAGVLGVEGIDEEMIAEAILRVAERGKDVSDEIPVTVAELYDAGLVGGKNSCEQRSRFLRSVGLPEWLSTKKMLQYLNKIPGPEMFRDLLNNFSN